MSRSFSITVPGKSISLNQERKEHWTKRYERTLQWRTDAYHMALLQRPIVPFENPVVVIVQAFQAKGTLTDPGNIYGDAKACLDGLRDAGVIADDTGAQVAAVTLLAPLRGPDALEVTLTELEQKEGKQ